jgi:hypothetical protein
MTPTPDEPRSQRVERFHLGEGMALIAGLAVALWLFAEPLKQTMALGRAEPPFFHQIDSGIFLVVVVLLGGLSCVGVPLLMAERRRRRRPAWGEGKTLWFATGLSSWLLWPPIVQRRVTGSSSSVSGMSEACYLYGTPLMALYMVWALWAGGRLRRNRRRRQAARSWRERFGLILGLCWACTGLYLLALIYRQEIFRR